jgi:hypothetical protein
MEEPSPSPVFPLAACRNNISSGVHVLAVPMEDVTKREPGDVQSEYVCKGEPFNELLSIVSHESLKQMVCFFFLPTP